MHECFVTKNIEKYCIEKSIFSYIVSAEKNRFLAKSDRDRDPPNTQIGGLWSWLRAEMEIGPVRSLHKPISHEGAGKINTFFGVPCWLA